MVVDMHSEFVNMAMQGVRARRAGEPAQGFAHGITPLDR